MAQDTKIGSIADVARAVQLAGVDDDKAMGRAVFFIGAGCSKTAGIPAAAEIAKELILRVAPKLGAPKSALETDEKAYRWLAASGKFRDCWAGGRLQDGEDSRPIDWYLVYDALFSDHYTVPDDVREIFCNYVEHAGGKVNWAHLCLGELVRRKFVSTVLTTNFDQLVLAGLVRSGVLPVVSDGIESLTRIRGVSRHAQLVELHGSRHTYRLRNSPQEVAALAGDQQVIGAVSSIFQDLRTFIVVGYGGREDGVMDLLVKASASFSDKRLIWVSHGKDSDALSGKAKKLLATSRNSLLLVGEDADSFFLRLLQHMGIGAPQTIKEPLALVRQYVDSISNHSPDKVSESALIEAEVEHQRKEIAAIEEALNLHRSRKSRVEKLLFEGRNLRLSGKYSEAVRKFCEAADLGDDLAVWSEYGNVASAAGRHSQDQGTLEEAVRAWKRVVECSSSQIAQFNLANALFELGERRGDGNLIDEAIGVYREVLKEWAAQDAPQSREAVEANLIAAETALKRVRGNATKHAAE